METAQILRCVEPAEIKELVHELSASTALDVDHAVDLEDYGPGKAIFFSLAAYCLPSGLASTF